MLSLTFLVRSFAQLWKQSIVSRRESLLTMNRVHNRKKVCAVSLDEFIRSFFLQLFLDL